MDPNQQPTGPIWTLPILLRDRHQQQQHQQQPYQQQPYQQQPFQQAQYQQPQYQQPQYQQPQYQQQYQQQALAAYPLPQYYPGPMQHVPQPNMQMSLAFRPAPTQASRPIAGARYPAWLQNNGIQPFGYAPGAVQNQQYSGVQPAPAHPGSSTHYPVAVEGRSLEDILSTLAQFAPASWAAPTIKIGDTGDEAPSLPTHVTGFDGVRIKEEDTSDGHHHRLRCDTDTRPHSPEQLVPKRPTRPRRPRANGSTSDTTCHNATHLVDQLYHHRLKCGHEVFTAKPQPCGSNCEVLRGCQPPTQVPFMCPDVGCERQWKRLERKEQKAFAAKDKPGRLCYRSETEGTSEAAMAQRNAEVFCKQEELAGLPPQRQRRKAKAARGRSRSPVRDRQAGSREQRERSPLMLDANDAELLERNRYQEATVKIEKEAVMSMVPEHIADKQKPWSYRNGKTMAGPGKLAYETGNVTEWSMPEYRIDDPNRGDHPVTMEPAFISDVVSRQAQQLADWDVDVQQTYCTCQAPSDGYMLPCSDCHLFFHPFCVGKATQPMTEYGGDKDHEAKLRDRQFWHDAEVFICKFCNNRRAAKTRNMSFKQQEAERKRVRREFERIEDGVSHEEAEAKDFFGYVCSGCYERIVDSRFRCRLCPGDDKGFSFCISCAADPKMSVIHTHEGGSKSKNGGSRRKQTAKARVGDDVMMSG